MATGRSTQIVRQMGEHLVAAELGRRGYLATPFAGNLPVIDLLVADADGRAMPIQVKAIKAPSPSWQFSARDFLEVDIVGGEQFVRRKRKVPYRDLVCVFVRLKEAGSDEFFVLRFRDLQNHFGKHYRGGRRPKNPDSMHCAVWPKEIVRFRDRWDIIADSFDQKPRRRVGDANAK